MVRILQLEDPEEPERNPVTKVELVTPQKAQKWLTRNTINRKLVPSWARFLADLMTAGKWRLTHQGIAFSTEGELIDGQHRLMAVVISGVSVKMNVTRGLPADSFAVIDTGRMRSAGNVLASVGLTDSVVTASALRLVTVYQTALATDAPAATFGPLDRKKVANEEILLAYYRNPSITEWPLRARNAYRVMHIGSMAAVMAGMYVASTDSAVAAEQFAEGLIAGIGLRQGDPRLALRNRTRPDSARGRGPEAFLMVLRAFIAFRDGESIRTLRMPKDYAPELGICKREMTDGGSNT